MSARIDDHTAWAARGYWRDAYESLLADTRTDTIPDPLDDPRVVALIEALRFADNTFRDLGWHSKWEVTSDALSTITKEPPHDR